MKEDQKLSNNINDVIHQDTIYESYRGCYTDDTKFSISKCYCEECISQDYEIQMKYSKKCLVIILKRYKKYQNHKKNCNSVNSW